MLGFSPLASLPLSAAYIKVGTSHSIPVEVLSTVTTVVEQIDIPIEILQVKTESEALKWVLNSRDKQWVLNKSSMTWTFNPRTNKWTIK